MTPVPAIVLAAGLGKRLSAQVPKVLCKAAGRPLLDWVVQTLREAGASPLVIVEPPSSPRPSDTRSDRDCRFVAQRERLGTGHAVLQAAPALDGYAGPVLVVNGDMPLISATSLRRLMEPANAEFGKLLVARASELVGSGLGRVFLEKDGRVESVVEARDLAAREDSSPYVNVGAYLFRLPTGFLLLEKVGKNNAQGEYYLTDIVRLARRQGLRFLAVMTDSSIEALGVNTPSDLARVEDELNRRID